MLNLPQTRLPTPTVFDGSTPTIPEWARELRAYLNISQFEHIDLLDFAYDAEQPLTTDIMAQQTPAGHRQHQEIQRLMQVKTSEMTARRALPANAAARRANAGIDANINQINTTSTHNKLFITVLPLQEHVERNLVGQRHRNKSSFKNGFKTSLPTT